MRELDDLHEFEAWLATASLDGEPVAVQDLDLLALGGEMMALEWRDSLFLGCQLDDAVAGHIVAGGGVVIPDLKDLEFPVHRARLYDAAELFAGFDPADPKGYELTWDSKVYRQFIDHGRDQPPSIRVSLARRLHDHSITDAVVELVQDRKVVAIMGGHGMERRNPFYATVARIARRLTREGYLMISGGGPGAMEATHLGAWFATRGDDDLDTALAMLGQRPDGAPEGKEYADPDWLHRAWAVMQCFPLSAEDRKACSSLGIPTWLYGHEPPAVFATHIAKYFANSVREDGLLALALDGVVFAPGSAGTTQEIFQDATQNHYGTAGVYSPMILLGEDHWTQKRPLWSFLQHAAAGHRYSELLALTDNEDEIIERLLNFRRDDYRVASSD